MGRKQSLFGESNCEVASEQQLSGKASRPYMIVSRVKVLEVMQAAQTNHQLDALAQDS